MIRHIQLTISLICIWVVLNSNVNAFVKVMMTIIFLTYVLTLSISLFIKRKNN